MLTKVVKEGLREAEVTDEVMDRGIALAEQMEPYQDDMEMVTANTIVLTVALDTRLRKIESFLADLATRVEPEDDKSRVVVDYPH